MLSHDAGLLDRLREDLTHAGYTVSGVQGLIGPVAHAALAREHPLPALRAVERGRAQDAERRDLATLLACFVLGSPVERAELDHALPRLGAEGAARLGLVEAAGHDRHDPVRPLVDLRPYTCQDDAGQAHWWIASDLGELATGAPLRSDHVLGVGGASVMLAGCTIRTPVGSVLDLGTGCGIQALHAARHADQVLGTDISHRALAVARFNLALNGADRVATRHGHLLDPVEGERFDLVVSNPPFVIRPAGAGPAAYTYRESGAAAGDDVVRRLVTGLPAVLADRGVAQLLGNWEHRHAQPWTERVAGWLEQAAQAAGDDILDAWVVQREVQDPAEYAETWVRDAGHHGPAADQLYRAYLDDFDARGVTAIGFGIVVLRRRPADVADAAPPWRRVEEQRGGRAQGLGEYLRACLAGIEFQLGFGRTALERARLRVAPDVTEERHHRPGEGDPAVILLRQGGGFGRVRQTSTELAALVGACDGELPLGMLLDALSQVLEVDRDHLTGRLLPQVRDLIDDAMLLPPAAAGSARGSAADGGGPA